MSELETDRERVIQTLCAHFAHDNLNTQELELRFEHAYQAQTGAELRALVAGLPSLPPEALPATPLYGVAPRAQAEREKRHLVVMSNVSKRGQWTPARDTKVTCVMGSAKFDLREAYLLDGETHFDLKVVIGEVELIVPPGLRVEADGFAIMGEFDDAHSAGVVDPHAPVIRVSGSVIMGASRIKTRLPGESGLQAWRRRLLESGH
ncbi:MAG TPA: LiaF domain-containing protein [Gemmatimonadaceae bacterium]|nr:LiaF domain-containing protein [Gemmatimonadaceae bacterium]